MRLLTMILTGINILLLSSCFNIPYYNDEIDLQNSGGVVLQSDRRMLWVLGHENEKRICAEPSPDAAVNSLYQLALEKKNAEGDSIGLSSQSANAIVQLGSRNQGIQQLRDWTYRMCEGWANKAIGKTQFQRSMQAYPAAMITSQAIDALSPQQYSRKGGGISINNYFSKHTGTAKATTSNSLAMTINNNTSSRTSTTQYINERTQAIKDLVLNFTKYQKEVVFGNECSSNINPKTITRVGLKDAIDCNIDLSNTNLKTALQKTNIDLNNNTKLVTLYGLNIDKDKYNNSKDGIKKWSKIKIARPSHAPDADKDLHNLYPARNILNKIKSGYRDNNGEISKGDRKGYKFGYINQNNKNKIKNVFKCYDNTQTFTVEVTNNGVITISTAATAKTILITKKSSIDEIQLCDEGTWQLPKKVRGDVARALFYVNIRYDYDISKVANIKDMKDWHYEDPVDTFERNRNAVIRILQGNSNPFIDHYYTKEGNLLRFIY